MSNAQHGSFIKGPACDLHSDGQAIGREADGMDTVGRPTMLNGRVKRVSEAIAVSESVPHGSCRASMRGGGMGEVGVTTTSAALKISSNSCFITSCDRSART